jgi:hypothetical protein
LSLPLLMVLVVSLRIVQSPDIDVDVDIQKVQDFQGEVELSVHPRDSMNRISTFAFSLSHSRTV